MIRSWRYLAGASLLSLNSLAFAQAPAATPPVAPVGAPQGEDARIEALQQQINALQAQVEELRKTSTATAPSWKGAPQWQDKEAGWSFKPKGFLQFDAGYVSTPGPKLDGTVGGLDYNNLGWNLRDRRIVVGAEGSIPGGFGYNVNFLLSGGEVGYEDVVLTWSGKKVELALGHQFPFSSLETLTSSRFTSFLERASLTEAFGYTRGMGLTVAYRPLEDVLIQGALLGEGIDDGEDFARTGWQAGVRGVWFPKVGDGTQLHLAASYQHRNNPRDEQAARYRARPFTQLTNQRFVDSGLIAADGDDIVGVELAAINGPVHFASEAHKLWVRGYAPGKEFGPNNGAGNGLFYNEDPEFWSAYAEIGYFLTGESRGYRAGKWDRTKVLRPVTEGGPGAIQINARIDHLDLSSATGAGPEIAAPWFVNGGKQTGYAMSVIWAPIDYVRFTAQYARAHVEGGPRAATVVPGTKPILDRSYNVDMFGVRAQVDF